MPSKGGGVVSLFFFSLLFSGPGVVGRWCGPDELVDERGVIRLALVPADCAWVGLGGLELKGPNLLAFSDVLRAHKALVHLGLGGNRLGDSGLEELARGLHRGGSELEWLSLHTNGIDDRGARALAEALRGHHSLRTLSLWENDIGDEGLAALGQALAQNTALEVGGPHPPTHPRSLPKRARARFLNLWPLP